MVARAIRITAVPRSDHPNSGLQAMHFARHFSDEVWALPASGNYIGDYSNVRFFVLDRDSIKRRLPIRFIRMAFLFWLFFAVMLRRKQLYFVHSFLFSLPPFLLKCKFCLFFHGSDDRFLNNRWGRAIANGAIVSYGVGFGFESNDLVVREVPNIFIPAKTRLDLEILHDVLFVLRDAPVKNPYYPIELAENLGLELGLRVAVLGISERELPIHERERLRRVQANGVAIAYYGRQPYHEVVKLMQSSHVIMVPSHSEGIPKVILEGMAQGMRALVNKVLTFPKDLDDRVHKIALDDWNSLSSYIKVERSSQRSLSNIEFARRYLEESQKTLTNFYNEVYSAHGCGHRAAGDA
jgi:Glycosyl transferases group 1